MGLMFSSGLFSLQSYWIAIWVVIFLGGTISVSKLGPDTDILWMSSDYSYFCVSTDGALSALWCAIGELYWCRRKTRIRWATPEWSLSWKDCRMNVWNFTWRDNMRHKNTDYKPHSLDKSKSRMGQSVYKCEVSWPFSRLRIKFSTLVVHSYST